MAHVKSQDTRRAGGAFLLVFKNLSLTRHMDMHMHMACVCVCVRERERVRARPVPSVGWSGQSARPGFVSLYLIS